MPKSVHARVIVAARAQLLEVASEALAIALDAVETRLVQSPLAGARPAGSRQIERTREVLERDRALASSTIAKPPAGPGLARATPPAAPALAQTAVECDEPIRTRSMAKLLAAQGHPDRALAIYSYLLARSDGDPTLLHAEIAALQSQPAAAHEQQQE